MSISTTASYPKLLYYWWFNTVLWWFEIISLLMNCCILHFTSRVLLYAIPPSFKFLHCCTSMVGLILWPVTMLPMNIIIQFYRLIDDGVDITSYWYPHIRPIRTFWTTYFGMDPNGLPDPVASDPPPIFFFLVTYHPIASFMIILCWIGWFVRRGYQCDWVRWWFLVFPLWFDQLLISFWSAFG